MSKELVIKCCENLVQQYDEHCAYNDSNPRLSRNSGICAELRHATGTTAWSYSLVMDNYDKVTHLGNYGEFTAARYELVKQILQDARSGRFDDWQGTAEAPQEIIE